MEFTNGRMDRVGNGGLRSFSDYLKEAMEELEKENWDYKRCERALRKAVSVVIGNTSEKFCNGKEG